MAVGALVEARLLRLEVRREVAAEVASLDAKIDALCNRDRRAAR
jgi:hypothetical protein